MLHDKIIITVSIICKDLLPHETWGTYIKWC